MSSALERLKALAAAKKAAEAKEKQNEPVQVSNSESTDAQANTVPAGTCAGSSNSGGSPVPAISVPNNANSDSAPTSPVAQPANSSSVPDKGESQAPASEHPLRMELAELEQALLNELPEFKTILKDIHSKLRQDPELVTALSEEEIESIVVGLTRHASLEILAPKAAKAAKAATARAKKVPISASDL